jgi:hypothetical protein
MVRDGDAMGVSSQIMQHMFGAAEGRLGIDDPVLPIKRAEEAGEAREVTTAIPVRCSRIYGRSAGIDHIDTCNSRRVS